MASAGSSPRPVSAGALPPRAPLSGLNPDVLPGRKRAGSLDPLDLARPVSAGPSLAGSPAASIEAKEVLSVGTSSPGSSRAALPPLHHSPPKRARADSSPPTSAHSSPRSFGRLRSAGTLLSTEGESNSSTEDEPQLGASLRRLAPFRMRRNSAPGSSPAEPEVAITCGEGAVRFYRNTGGLIVHGPGEDPARVAKLSWGPDGFLYVHLADGSYRSLYVEPAHRTAAATQLKQIGAQAQVPIEYLSSGLKRCRSSFGCKSSRPHDAAVVAASLVVPSAAASRHRCAAAAPPPAPLRRRETLPAPLPAGGDNKEENIRRSETMPLGAYEKTVQDLAEHCRSLQNNEKKKVDPGRAHARWLQEQGLAPAAALKKKASAASRMKA